MSEQATNGSNGQAGKSRRGFASMNRERQREIASKGGRAAHAKGTAHEWSSDEARQAGQKGGITVSRDRAHMAAIGREGGRGQGGERELSRQVSREDGGERGSSAMSGAKGRSDAQEQASVDTR